MGANMAWKAAPMAKVMAPRKKNTRAGTRPAGSRPSAACQKPAISKRMPATPTK